MKLTDDQSEELRAVLLANAALKGPSFMHVLHRDAYAPLVEAGLVEWIEPHPKMGASFAATTVTDAGARAVAHVRLGTE